MYSNAQYGIDRSTHRLLSHVVTSTTANFSVSVSMANSINSSSSSSTTSNNNQWPANFLFPEPSSYEQVIIVKMVNYQSLQNTIQFELLNIKVNTHTLTYKRNYNCDSHKQTNNQSRHFFFFMLFITDEQFFILLLLF